MMYVPPGKYRQLPAFMALMAASIAAVSSEAPSPAAPKFLTEMSPLRLDMSRVFGAAAKAAPAWAAAKADPPIPIPAIRRSRRR
jgi:hypothetical protein